MTTTTLTAPITSGEALKIARDALEKISNWSFGWDGDCGVAAFADEALAATEQVQVPSGELPTSDQLRAIVRSLGGSTDKPGADEYAMAGWKAALAQRAGAADKHITMTDELRSALITWARAEKGETDADEALIEFINGNAAGAADKPVAWIRFRSDGGYEGPLMDEAMEDVRKKSGAWTPLYAAPVAATADAAPAGAVADDAARYQTMRNIYAAPYRIIPGPVYMAETPDQLDAALDAIRRGSPTAAEVTPAPAASEKHHAESAYCSAASSTGRPAEQSEQNQGLTQGMGHFDQQTSTRVDATAGSVPDEAERIDFETWFARRSPHTNISRLPSGHYEAPRVEDLWQDYVRRAAQTKNPADEGGKEKA